MNNIKIKLSVIANSIAIFALSILSIISFYFTKDSLYQSTLHAETDLLKATQISIEILDPEIYLCLMLLKKIY